MTGAVQEPAGLERLLGTVGEAMTRAVVALAADMPAEWALRHLDRQAVSGAPVVDRSDRPLGILTRDDVLRAVAGPPGPTAERCAQGPSRAARPSR